MPMAGPESTAAAQAQLELRPLSRAELPLLQTLFEHNAAYFELVHGMPPRPDEAAREFDDRPPPHLPYREVVVLGLLDGDGRSGLAGVAVWVADFVVAGAWHLGLFMLDPAHHGGGMAHAVWPRLEQWAAAQGARWLRLSIVQGNHRAARF